MRLLNRVYGKATNDEEMVQVRFLQDNLPVYRFVSVKALSKANTAGTVSIVVSALETECECHDWKSKLVGLSADGAAVNMGVRSGAAKQLQGKVPHLLPFTWPSDHSALVRFGYDEVRLLSGHFSQPLQQKGYTPESCVDEWPELKLRVQEICSLEPLVGYLPMWQRILNEGKTQPAIGNILALVRISLVTPVQTATLEQGFSLMKRVKTDWRNWLQPQTLSQLMMIMLNGLDLENFDAQPAISQWWKAGPRSRWTSSELYGPRLSRPQPESETESSDSEDNMDS